MTSRSARKRPKLNGPDTAKYEVGYGKPPVRTRFKPGESGNRRGRPKGAKNKVPALNEERLKSIILEEAYRAIRINDGDRQIKVPMAQAIVRAIAVNAAKGQSRAQKLFTEMLTMTERENRALHDQWLETAMNYKIDWERELERRKALGITGLPDPLPHPDHVVIDFKAGTARIAGPMSKEEKRLHDLFTEHREDVKTELRELEELAKDPDYPYRDMVLRDLEYARWFQSVIETLDENWKP